MFLSHNLPLHFYSLFLHLSFHFSPPLSLPTSHFVHPLLPFLSPSPSCICTSCHTFQTQILQSFFIFLFSILTSLIQFQPFFPAPPSFSPSSFSSCHCSAQPQRAPGASPSAHNISSAAVSDRPNFSRGVGIRSTFHAGQQRGARDQQGSAYPGGPASPSLSHGNSQARRTHGATGIFSKFTSKFVRRLVNMTSKKKYYLEPLKGF